MSWLYVPGLPCSPKASELHSSILDSTCELSVTLNAKPLLLPSLSRSWKRDAWMQRLSGLTCAPSTLDAGVEQWISSLRASRAPTFPLLAVEPDSTEHGADYFLKLCGSPPIAKRGSSCWKTWQPSLLPSPPLWTKRKGLSTSARPPESWENWPTAGGVRNGSLFPRPMWVPATGAAAGSASPGGWATPDCNTSTYSNGRMGPNIRQQASTWLTPAGMTGVDHTGKMGSGGEFAKQATQWLPTEPAVVSARPTPRGTDGIKGGPNQAGSKGDLMLPSAAAQWPTPRTITGGGESAQRKQELGRVDAGGGDLQAAVQQWPTPASRDYRSPNSLSLEARGGGMKGEQLPNFVEHHFSLPQAQPTNDGQESSPTTLISRRRLNPAFGCWLMNWPWWWTNPGITSSVRSEMVSYRFRLQSHLSSLLGEQES